MVTSMLDKTFAFLESEREYIHSLPSRHRHSDLFEAAEIEVRALRTLPPIVCLCGSTRFRDNILATSEWLTMTGAIVLAPNVFGREPGDKDKPEDMRPITDGQKALLDALHFRKIDLATRVHVVNIDGYIGHSVHNEVKYAVSKGKLVTFTDNHVLPWDGGRGPISTRHYLMTVERRIKAEGGS